MFVFLNLIDQQYNYIFLKIVCRGPDIRTVSTFMGQWGTLVMRKAKGLRLFWLWKIRRLHIFYQEIIFRRNSRSFCHNLCSDVRNGERIKFLNDKRIGETPFYLTVFIHVTYRLLDP